MPMRRGVDLLHLLLGLTEPAVYTICAIVQPSFILRLGDAFSSEFTFVRAPHHESCILPARSLLGPAALDQGLALDLESSGHALSCTSPTRLFQSAVRNIDAIT